MYKIRRVKFQNHPILKNLELDFCDMNGNAADTIILAGENGTGKSTILDALYKMAHYSVNFEFRVELEDDDNIVKLTYYCRDNKYFYVSDEKGLNAYIENSIVKDRYKFNGIFSDVDIIFRSETISSVTSLDLDTFSESKRSSQNLPKEIKQLLVDIQALDDADVSHICRANPDKGINDLIITERMPRFTKAFNKMFNTLSYSRVKNQNGHKEIVFVKNGEEITIDHLSSGEKQIVYRGCFLLKDVNALNGAFVFIDEPEISLHPSWQEKIMEYYKGIFTDDEGHQTSQIFVVTHSPFIIHNKNRKNDKVIILERNDDGEIVASDKKEYYKCDSIEAVEDAFHIDTFSKSAFQETPTVYLEGRTDEMYFNKAIEVYNLELPFSFKWVGYLDGKNEVNTGKDSVAQAFHFLVASNLPYKNICLFDNDVNKKLSNTGNVYVTGLSKYSRSKMKIGIENVLRLDDVDIYDCYDNKETTGDYGEKKIIQSLDKMKCCEKICSMPSENLKEIFADLKTEIDTLVRIFNGDKQ